MNYGKDNNYEVIIIGGGFAGLISARELQSLGYKTILLEGRDRLGGRTWTDKRLGHNLEMGGTYVHWSHPHTWSEITRYGLELSEAPTAKNAYWITNDKLQTGTPKELNSKVQQAFEKLLAIGCDYIPQPFQPINEAVANIDEQTVYDFLNNIELSNEERDFIDSLLSIDFNGNPAEGAISQIFRWWSFSNKNRFTFADTVSRFKIKTGMSSLVNAIADDVKSEIKLSTVVTSIEQNDEGAIVTTADGETYRGNTVLVTAPPSTLENIQFKPELSATKQAFIKEKQVSRGVKVWAKVKGELDPFIMYAPSNYLLNSAHIDSYLDGYSIIVAFGTNESLLDTDNPKAVEEALRVWLPTIEVVESTAHRWIEDPFSQETWSMLKPNQLTNYIEEMARPEGSVYIAGAANAKGWGGFIDGAIESALTTTRKIHYNLQKKKCLPKSMGKGLDVHEQS